PNKVFNPGEFLRAFAFWKGFPADVHFWIFGFYRFGDRVKMVSRCPAVLVQVELVLERLVVYAFDLRGAKHDLVRSRDTACLISLLGHGVRLPVWKSAHGGQD